MTHKPLPVTEDRLREHEEQVLRWDWSPNRQSILDYIAEIRRLRSAKSNTIDEILGYIAGSTFTREAMPIVENVMTLIRDRFKDDALDTRTPGLIHHAYGKHPPMRPMTAEEATPYTAHLPRREPSARDRAVFEEYDRRIAEGTASYITDEEHRERRAVLEATVACQCCGQDCAKDSLYCIACHSSREEDAAELRARIAELEAELAHAKRTTTSADLRAMGIGVLPKQDPISDEMCAALASEPEKKP